MVDLRNAYDFDYVDLIFYAQSIHAHVLYFLEHVLHTSHIHCVTLFSQLMSQAFLESWEALDKDGSGMLPAACLTSILMAVRPPMGVKGLDRVPKRIQAIVCEAAIPLRWALRVRIDGI